MRAGPFDEEDMFRAIADRGVRALLIGRRALIALGLPVLTADYDFWVHIDDIEAFNEALEPMGVHPNNSPQQARQRGRYVLENDERIDVLVARAASTQDGIELAFDDAWARRRTVPYVPGLDIAVPSIDDLILTKRWSMRRKDVLDIDLLEKLKRGGGEADGP